ncbi:Isochorismatase-like protein [Aspergillus aurantiobrunneus]
MPAQSFRQTIGIPPSTASPHDSTLIIIDAQNEYANGHLKITEVDSSRKEIAVLLSKYRSAGQARNIVHVLHETPAGAPVFTPKTALAQEFEELAPLPGEKVITKTVPSSFGFTDLHEYLGGLGAVGKKIVLVGYMAHVCVSTTARAGNELGYDVIVVKDAIGDRDIPGVDARTLKGVVLAELADAFATVVSGAEISA